MKRTIITVDTINEAKRQGARELSVPCNGIVTPAATDMATACGISLLRESACATGAPGQPCALNYTKPSGSGFAPKTVQQERSAMPSATKSLGAALASTPAVRPATAKPVPTPASHVVSAKPAFAPAAPVPAATSVPAKDANVLFTEIKKRVLARLPESLRSSPVLDAVIRKSLEGVLQLAAASPAQAGRPSSQKLPAQATPAGPSAKNGTAQPVSEPTSAAHPAKPWREQAGQGLRIDSSRLPWKKLTSAADGVNIIDAVTACDGTPFAAGYMEWDAASFLWKAECHEIATVLQGELCLTMNGRTLTGKPGDVLYIPKGTDVTFSSPGYVKFAYVTCPSNHSPGD